MVDAAKPRAHGQTGAEEEAKERGKELDRTMGEGPPDSSDRPLNLTRAFQRMRTDWNPQDREKVDSIKRMVDRAIWDDFQEANTLIYEIFDRVRAKVVNEKTGEIEIYSDGLPQWKQNPDGSYVEDWGLITNKDRERWLYKINMYLFKWEQTAADIWGEALLAKAQWEEAFATGFDSISDSKATVDARNARANKLAADQRYLAVYKSMYSKKADAIVRSMERISQRLKDLHAN